MKKQKDIIPVLTLALIVLLNSHCSNAICQDVLPDSLMNERINVITGMLNQGKKGANLWWKGWLVGYGAATVAQTALAITSDDLKGRQDWSLSALSTLLGAAGQLIAPMPKGYTSDLLNEMPQDSPEQLRLKLQTAEKLLFECAQREKHGRSWKTHALDGAVNLGFGAVVWFGFDRYFAEGAGNFVLNSVICETQIFTQPVRAIKDYNRYMQKYRPGNASYLRSEEVSWYFTMMPGGLGFRVVF
ncbi:MAG TPA: hypothetical protein VK179_15890 [Bacteroidales bacterium]|nr:hypothetical protein [Bacteroidales bacterium]